MEFCPYYQQMVSVNPDQLQSQAQSMSLIALWSTQEFDKTVVASYHWLSLFIVHPLSILLISAPVLQALLVALFIL